MVNQGSTEETNPLLVKGTNDAYSEELKSPPKNSYIGLVYMGFSSLLFALMASAIRFASSEFPTPYIAFTRGLLQLTASGLYCAYAGINPFGPNAAARRVLAMRGIFGFMGASSYYFALRFLPVGDAASITFTGPVILILLAAVILGEQVEPATIAAACIAFVGVVLVARPTSFSLAWGSAEGKQRLLGCVCALLQAFFSSFSYLSIRKLGAKVHAACSVFAFGLYVTPLMAIEGAVLGTSVFILPHGARSWFAIIAAGVCALSANSFLSIALQKVEASKVAPMRNLQLLFAFFFGWLFLNEQPRMTSIVGAMIILSSTVFLGLWTWLRSRREQVN